MSTPVGFGASAFVLVFLSCFGTPSSASHPFNVAGFFCSTSEHGHSQKQRLWKDQVRRVLTAKAAPCRTGSLPNRAVL